MTQMRAFLSLFTFVLLHAPGLAIAGDDRNIIGKGAEVLPLFDAHMHYKRSAWIPFPPNVVLSIMDKNGVAMALVSSSPDEGTIKLWEYAPKRIVPEMRPYNDHFGPSNWTKWDGVGDYIKKRVTEYPHESIGEFHLHRVDPADEPLMKNIVAQALNKKIPLHVHSDREPIEYLYSLSPDLTIIWAHAGMTEPASIVGKMMARYPTLYADTSYRETDILNHTEGINEEWRQLLERFAERFMVGSDTWINDQWEDYDHLIAINRRWLAHLTAESARKIAYQNAERLFGRKIGPQLFGTR
ncbi:MAG: amidohydrolase [Candidatus Thiodiazotropha endolucinida]|nr:amidohydrolase [Candidatus Thiodiazotropha taylori]MCW4266785.1 amidohydrolase [Candidatus Thiodiazotropha endolucinida]